MSVNISASNPSDYNGNYVLSNQLNGTIATSNLVFASSSGGTIGGSGFASISVPIATYQSKEPVTIGAALYFKYVKKKFTKLQQKELEARLKKLVNLRLQAITCDQMGLLENVESMLLTAAREQCLVVKGMERYVLKEHVNKFMSKTKNIYMNSLDKFPRPVPASVQKKIVAAKAMQVFDDFQVLYTDYTSVPVAKSSADKIREKDPILFGTMAGAPDRLYYIADWVDEYCDLTLDKLVSSYKPEDGTDLVQEIMDLKTPEALEKLTAKVQGRLDALNQTTRENWRQKEKAAAVAHVAGPMGPVGAPGKDGKDAPGFWRGLFDLWSK